jgi:hypothetical protein
MVAKLKFYFKDYKSAIQIQGIESSSDIDFYFPTKKSYKQFKEYFYYSQNREENLKKVV